MEEIYPILKKYCKEKGLEFQAIDMRWGVPEEAQIDHLTSDLCMREVNKCKRVSFGPSCVVSGFSLYEIRKYVVNS